MKAFTDYLIKQSFNGYRAGITDEIIAQAFAAVVKDVGYHAPEQSEKDVKAAIESNDNELAIYLYRLGRAVFLTDTKNKATLQTLHGLMRQFCGCEIYFSNDIGPGFRVVHGLGTVIGSRNKIGNGFRIYQGCTIGHRVDIEPGATIGSDVTMYAGSSVLGAVRIGDRATIAAHALILSDLAPNGVYYGVHK